MWYTSGFRSCQLLFTTSLVSVFFSPPASYVWLSLLMLMPVDAAVAWVFGVPGLWSSWPFVYLSSWWRFLFVSIVFHSLYLYTSSVQLHWNMLIGRPHHAESAWLPEQPCCPSWYDTLHWIEFPAVSIMEHTRVHGPACLLSISCDTEALQELGSCHCPFLLDIFFNSISD